MAEQELPPTPGENTKSGQTLRKPKHIKPGQEMEEEVHVQRHDAYCTASMLVGS